MQGYSYSSDYEIISKLKRFADKHHLCLLLVHHTRKQQAEDEFERISGTNGLLGAADGGFMLAKEKRTGNSATLKIVGRYQQEQLLYLAKDMERLTWRLEKAETETWKEPPDPILEAIAALVTAEAPEWIGTSTELVERLGLDMKANALAMRLNVKASRLRNEYKVNYENSRNHAGRCIRLTFMSEA